MERDEVDGERSEEKELTLGEHLDQLCEYYMALGVPYEVFWYGDYCSLKYYEKSYLLRRKINNEEMWMQGVYNYAAHETSLANAFRGKGHKPQQFLKEPIQFFPKTEAEEKAEMEELRKRTIANLNRLKEEWDKANVSSNNRT